MKRIKKQSFVTVSLLTAMTVPVLGAFAAETTGTASQAQAPKRYATAAEQRKAYQEYKQKLEQYERWKKTQTGKPSPVSTDQKKIDKKLDMTPVGPKVVPNAPPPPRVPAASIIQPPPKTMASPWQPTDYLAKAKVAPSISAQAGGGAPLSPQDAFVAQIKASLPAIPAVAKYDGAGVDQVVNWDHSEKINYYQKAVSRRSQVASGLNRAIELCRTARGRVDRAFINAVPKAGQTKAEYKKWKDGVVDSLLGPYQDYARTKYYELLDADSLVSMTGNEVNASLGAVDVAPWAPRYFKDLEALDAGVSQAG